MVKQHKASLKSNQPGEDHPQTQSKKYDKKLRIGRAAETSLAWLYQSDIRQNDDDTS